MAVILPPVAIWALRAGAIALIATALAARRGRAVLDHDRETTLDALPDGAGLIVDPDAGRADAAARVRRVVRLGAAGPGIAIDGAALLRLRLRRVAPGS